nr:hypothetical protein [Anaerolineae bacterium]
LRALPPSLGQLTQLWVLEVGGNPLTFPPPAVVLEGQSDILDYLRRHPGGVPALLAQRAGVVCGGLLALLRPVALWQR